MHLINWSSASVSNSVKVEGLAFRCVFTQCQGGKHQQWSQYIFCSVSLVIQSKGSSIESLFKYFPDLLHLFFVFCVCSKHSLWTHSPVPRVPSGLWGHSPHLCCSVNKVCKASVTLSRCLCSGPQFLWSHDSVVEKTVPQQSLLRAE